MSVQGTKAEETVKTTSTFAPGPQEQATPRAPGYEPGGDVFSLFSAMGASQALSAQIEEFIEKLKVRFNSENALQFGRIDIRRLDEPKGTHTVVLDNRAIILLFSEMLASDLQNFTPTSDQVAWAVERLHEQYGKDIRLSTVLVVQPCDYVRVDQMARYLQTSLIGGRPEFQGVNAQRINTCNYVVDPDVSLARRYIDRINPSAVMPRVDVGFTIMAKRPQRRPNNSARYTQPAEMVELAAVGAYTEILTHKDHVTGQLKYLPLVHITTIASELQLAGILPLCIAVAADQLISTGNWMRPFLSFQKGKPNLGQLFPDPKDGGKLWFANNQTAVDDLRRMHFLPAVLAIDVADGLARNPNLMAYGYPQHAGRVYDQIQDFFGASVQIDRAQAPYAIHGMDFIGVYGDQKGTLVDSRNMDYLSLVAEGASDAETNSLLGYFNEPSARARIISNKTANSFRSLYRNNVAVLSPLLLSSLALAVQQSMMIEAPQGQARMTSTDWMQAQSALYAQQNFSVTRTDNRSGFGIGSFYNV